MKLRYKINLRRVVSMSRRELELVHDELNSQDGLRRVGEWRYVVVEPGVRAELSCDAVPASAPENQ